MFPAKCTDRQVKEDAFNDSLKHSGFNPINYPVFVFFCKQRIVTANRYCFTMEKRTLQAILRPKIAF